MNEVNKIYTCETSFSMLNHKGFMKPYGYQSMMNAVAEEHLAAISCSMEELGKHGMAWVLMSACYEIIKPICGMTRLNARTWHSEQGKLTFRRDFSFTDESGNVCFNAATFSVLFDMEHRKMLFPCKLPIDLPSPNNVTTIEAQPHLRHKAAMESYDERVIYPSYIDRLGHTNNERYAEFVYDAFTPNEIDNLDKMKRFELYYINELHLGEKFSVRRGLDENGAVLIDGIAENAKKESFACRVKFDR